MSFRNAAAAVVLSTLAAPACAVVGADFKYTEREEKRFTTGGQPAIDSTGKLTFTPNINVAGTANITIHAHDTGGTADAESTSAS